MPLYEYQCDDPECGHITEVSHARIPRFITRFIECEKCRANARKIISKPNIQDPYPKWIDDNLRSQIQDDGEPPIESRTDLKKAEEEKGIVQNPRA